MGYESDRFMGGETIDPELICAICFSVLEDPVQLPCEHYFCEKCAIECLRARGRCPLDRKITTIHDLLPPSRLLLNLLSKLSIKCGFKDRGCRRVVKLDSLKDHMRQCAKRPNDYQEPRRFIHRPTAAPDVSRGDTSPDDDDVIPRDDDNDLAMMAGAAGIAVVVGGIAGLAISAFFSGSRRNRD